MLIRGAEADSGDMDFDTLIEELSEKDAVLYAGQHSEPTTVHNQKAVLSALYDKAAGKNREFVLGMEAFADGNKEREYLSMIHDPERLIDALESLAFLYIPDGLETADVPRTFKNSIAPFLDFAITNGISVEPLASSSMRGHKGCSDIKTWNRELACLINSYVEENRTFFGINGMKHFKDPSYESISVPSVLGESCPHIDFAVLIQPETYSGKPRISKDSSFQFETYHIEGKLD